jgi:hypothetical protein
MNKLLCHIPNNEDGQTFLKVLKKSLRGTPHGVWARGRGARKPHAHGNPRLHAHFRQDLPKIHATSFAVYLIEKPKYHYKKVTRVVQVPKTVMVERTETDYVKVPTKWA